MALRAFRAFTRLLRNSRITDSPAAATSAEFLHLLAPRPAAYALLRSLGCATLVLLVLVHFTPMTRWWARALAGNWTDSPGDTLIVLGSEMEADGVLGPSSYIRSLYAVRAYRESPFRKIIVTGGRSGAAALPLGDAMRDFITANGVPRGVISVEGRATSTRENALFVEPMLRGTGGTTVLMTSDFHMFRARRVFERAGVHVVPRPIPDVLKRSNRIVNRWVAFWTLVFETGKIGYYAWNRWL
jgi:uncharacterized SAM-binding protein YcdF (DUF218 family)